MAIHTQKLELVERRWDALLQGHKLDTIRYNEASISEGLLLYESFPSACRYAVVYVTDTREIALSDVLKYTNDTKRKPDEQALLKKVSAHYPDISLDSIVSYVQHLSVDETKRKFGNEVEIILNEAHQDLDARPKPQVIFFANPFGLGPSGKAFAVLNRAKEMFDCEWYFAGSSECKSIGNFEKVEFIEIDERDSAAIEKLLSTFERPFVVSSLNRFAISAAKKMEIPSALIDGLAWMWDPIPEQLLKSDFYFALRFPNLEASVAQHEHIKVVDYIAQDDGVDQIDDRSGILFHLGGMWNPLTKTSPISYLNLLSETLNLVQLEETITVCGSKKAMDYVRAKNKNSRITFATLNKKEFEEHLRRAKRFITTPGLTASMEAFSYGTPTSFLPPTNLSQLKILKIFRDYEATTDSVLWNQFADNFEDVENLNEHDAILQIEKVAMIVETDLALKKRFVAKLIDLFSDDPPAERQQRFIRELGSNGANQILLQLEDCWHLSRLNSPHVSV